MATAKKADETKKVTKATPAAALAKVEAVKKEEAAKKTAAMAAIVAKVKEVIGNKTVKELNVYYQPETGMVYYTADGESGSYSL